MNQPEMTKSPNPLQLLAKRIRDCQNCSLCSTRKNAVPGEGPINARLMFIAEGPGLNEDNQGRPFVGAAGTFLEQLLEQAGIRRQDVFITNMIKCRAPDNRDPSVQELAACNDYLDQQIELINPELIVTLGRFSLAKFLPGETISKARGQVRRRQGRNIFPVMHPAAGLRRTEFKEKVIQDFKAIPAILQMLQDQPMQDEPEPVRPAEQATMF